jgi:hypothetical protein
MSSSIDEICWIVNQRNIWAKKRSSLRHKVLYAQKIGKLELAKDLAAEYTAHNELRHALNTNTKRLKYLIKEVGCKLNSDRNAGYRSIVLLRSRSWLSKEEIAGAALAYEAEKAIDKALRSE